MAFSSYSQLDIDVTDDGVGPTVLIVSPCRSGSTALLTGLSLVADRAYFQPFKTALRRKIEGLSSPVALSLSGLTVIKETFGPYLDDEVSYDPLGLLLGYGVRPERLRVIALLRDPAACSASWQRSFRTTHFPLFNTRCFAPAYAATLATLTLARDHNIPSAGVAYSELGTDQMFRLFRSLPEPQLGDAVVRDWSSSRRFSPGRYAFTKYAEPTRFEVPGLLDGSLSRISLQVTPPVAGRGTLQSSVDSTDIALATDIYDQFILFR